MNNTKIKICGLSRDVDAEYVNESRPDYVGFIFWPKSHRCISKETAVRLRGLIDQAIKTVGVFVDEDNEIIVDIAKSGAIDFIQLHGSESEESICYLKEKTGLPIIKAVKIKTGDEIICYNDSAVDYLLLDSGYGTGKPFEWSKLLDSKLPVGERINKPFFLAGGLGAHNLKDAIEQFQPYAVDLSSSVETDKIKDRQKIMEVVDIVRRR